MNVPLKVGYLTVDLGLVKVRFIFPESFPCSKVGFEPAILKDSSLMKHLK